VVCSWPTPNEAVNVVLKLDCWDEFVRGRDGRFEDRKVAGAWEIVCLVSIKSGLYVGI
jgi:hypothetical protein